MQAGDTITQEQADTLNAHKSGRPNMSDFELANLRISAISTVIVDPNELDGRTDRANIFRLADEIVQYAITGTWEVSKPIPKYAQR